MRTIPSAFVVAALALASAGAMAQFPSIPGMGGSKSGSAPAVDQDALVRSYVAADKDVLNANAKMAEALGLKDAAVSAKATADALGDGATKDNLSAADKAQSETTAAIQAKLKDNPTLDAQAKVTYGQGLALLGSGVLKYVAMKPQVTGIGSNPMALLGGGKAAAVAYIATSVPTNAANLSSALNNATSFAKSREIPVPSDATSALAAI